MCTVRTVNGALAQSLVEEENNLEVGSAHRHNMAGKPVWELLSTPKLAMHMDVPVSMSIIFTDNELYPNIFLIYLLFI